MNTTNPTRTGARKGAGVVVALLALTATLIISCAAAPRAGASSPRTTPPAQASVATDGPDLRIRIARAVTTIKIASAEAFSVRAAGNGGAIALREPVSVTRTAAGFLLTSSGAAPSLVLGGPIVLEPAPGATLRLDGAEHLGAVELRAADSPDTFDAIERIGIESYLPGVVAAEVYPGWSPVAFEAQAIAARSYALHERARRRAAGDPFDLENTTIDQAYAGAKSSPKAREAVRSTRGVVLMHQGEPLRAYYSSACGGRPASARDTWPTGGEFAFNLAPPLQARERPFACGFSHHFSWAVTRDAGTLTRRIAGAGAQSGDAIRAIKSIGSIKAVEWNVAGRPSAFEVCDDAGRAWRVQADTLRHWCNASVKGLPDVPGEAMLRSGDIDAIVAGKTVQFTGRGFGHGVGMCQFGAEGFARRGWSRDRILRLYYPGATISAAY